MKNLDLAACGVEELNETQMRNIDGGIPWRKIAEAIGLHAAIEVLTDREGWESWSRMVDAAGGPAGYMPLR